MSKAVRLSRAVRVPDPVRIERARRVPELGPRIAFVSGGSALRSLSRVLKKYTHRSIHLVTPFDSGGSSATLRDAFQMVSVGDLRNRMMALADETVRGCPELCTLFDHRLPQDEPPEVLDHHLRTMLHGDHPLVAALEQPMRNLVRTQLRSFHQAKPADFDLRGANIGNLLLAGGFLANDRDIDSVVFLFSKLVEVRGTVRPVADADLHLAAVLENGRRVVGQHQLTGEACAALESPIAELSLVHSLSDPRPSGVDITQKVQQMILGADLFCYPIGSFYTSVLANLLPKGMGRSICSSGCPKVYVPNSGHDPEQGRMPVQACVQRLLDFVRRDAGDRPVEEVLDLVLVDKRHGQYAPTTDWDAVEDLGVPVLDLDLVHPHEAQRHDPHQLAAALVSLAS